jgi:hypothetical protein
LIADLRIVLPRAVYRSKIFRSKVFQIKSTGGCLLDCRSSDFAISGAVVSSLEFPVSPIKPKSTPRIDPIDREKKFLIISDLALISSHAIAISKRVLPVQRLIDLVRFSPGPISGSIPSGLRSWSIAVLRVQALHAPADVIGKIEKKALAYAPDDGGCLSSSVARPRLETLRDRLLRQTIDIVCPEACSQAHYLSIFCSIVVVSRSITLAAASRCDQICLVWHQPD